MFASVGFFGDLFAAVCSKLTLQPGCAKLSICRPSTRAHRIASNFCCVKIEDDDHAGADAWTTVPEKSRAVPVKSRKHPLQRDDSSPSNAVPAPKAQKENPLSPQPGSMQTSEMGSNQG